MPKVKRRGRKKSRPKVRKPKSSYRCWTGYKPVPGKKPFSKGSCKKM